jgi:CheY-like chemotaxis protein
MGRNVLVVDDHLPTVDLIRSALEAEGMQVSTADNGADALLSVSRGAPDLIILDVMMPVMDGFQTLQVLQQSDETKEIPVIMLTAKSGD